MDDRPPLGQAGAGNLARSGTGLPVRPQIEELVHRYALGLDEHDESLLRTCFWDDAVAEFSGLRLRPGVDAILGYLSAARGFAHTMHHVGGVVIKPTADATQANVESWTIAHLVSQPAEGKDAEVVMRGVRYRDLFLRRGNEWRIARRVHRVAWATTAPAELDPPMPPEFGRTAKAWLDSDADA